MVLGGVQGRPDAPMVHDRQVGQFGIDVVMQAGDRIPAGPARPRIGRDHHVADADVPDRFCSAVGEQDLRVRAEAAAPKHQLHRIAGQIAGRLHARQRGQPTRRSGETAVAVECRRRTPRNGAR